MRPNNISPTESMHSKKPSYFRTLPERIAQSPTGIHKLPNSRFPTIAPVNYKSVYERAGFDVYRPDKSRVNSHSSSPRSTLQDSRSASTSQITSPTHSVHHGNAQKRNLSEFYPKSKNHSAPNVKHGATPPVPNLQIDAKLANKTYSPGSSSPQSANTPRTAATVPVGQTNSQPQGTRSIPLSTIGVSFNRSEQLPPENSSSYPPRSATSSRFPILGATSANVPPQSAKSANFPPHSAVSSKFDIRSDSTTSSGPGGNDGGSVYMSTQSFQQGSNASLTDSVKSPVESVSSTNTAQRIPEIRVGEGPMKPMEVPAVQGLPTRSIPDEPPTRLIPVSNAPNKFARSRQQKPCHAQPSPQPVSTHECPEGQPQSPDRSIQGEYKPPAMVTESPDRSGADDYSFDQTNDSMGTVRYSPKKQIPNPSTTSLGDTLDSSDDELNLSSDEESDDESMKSVILSPNIQEGQGSEQPTPQLDETMRMSIPPNPPRHSIIPSFTVSDPEGNNITTSPPHSDLSPPVHSNRFSVASSMYDGEFSPERRESPYTSTGFDQSPIYEKDEFHDSNATVFEEVEHQLENLTMNSSHSHNLSQNSFDFTNDKTPSSSTSIVGAKGLQIEMHSVKHADTESMDHNSVNDQASQNTSQSIRSAPSSNEHRHSVAESVEYKEEDIKPLQISKPEKPKWPPGEGPCRKCGLDIMTKPIYSKSGELSGQWHRPCFTCTLCDVKFSKNISCFVLNDEPYCEYHYHLSNNSLCQVCGSGIVGKCLENDTHNRYHVDCLKCTKCHIQINSDYLSVNGQVYCEPCGMEFTGQMNLGSSHIERRRTRLYFI